MTKKLITCALPYANGKLHIGHMIEHIQGDIFARFNKLIGKDALFIGGADMHGTPVELNANKAGIPVLEFATKFKNEHHQNFKDYLINYDNYYSTHSKENKEFAHFFYKTLKDKGFVKIKESEQMYDEEAKRFLPDRYVKGTCPKCQAEDQYGDICEKCGSIYNPVDLINPYSTITNSKPVIKPTKHYFIELAKFSDKLKEWINNSESDIQQEIKNWLNGWINEGLKDWCISRDEPYFGFEIPDSKSETGAKKFFYVWLDAPIGYISSTKNYCEQHNLNWEDYWKNGEIHHIIGKDIIYFHYLFWPAMLMAVDFKLPKLTTHGFVNVQGKKMSKSRGTYFTAEDFLKMYEPESLRFYYALHLDNKVVDINIDFKDFQAVINNVMMGNIGNFCYRTLVFAQKNYLTIEDVADEKDLEEEVHLLIDAIRQDYMALDFKSAVKKTMKIADIGNSYFQKSEPWKNKDSVEAKGSVGFCVNLARTLSILLQPILPEFSKKVQASLSEENLKWDDIKFDWTGMLQKPEQLVVKIDKLPEVKEEPKKKKKVKKKVPVKEVKKEVKEKKEVPEEAKVSKDEQAPSETPALNDDGSTVSKETKDSKEDVKESEPKDEVKESKPEPKKPIVKKVKKKSKPEPKPKKPEDDSEEYIEIKVKEEPKPKKVVKKEKPKPKVIKEEPKVKKESKPKPKPKKAVKKEISKPKNEKPKEFPIQMRVGQIISVKDHPNADKLYIMKVDFGINKKQIIAGLKQHFKKEDLLHKTAVFVTNLKPIKLRGELSEGMSLIAADDKGNMSFLKPNNKVLGVKVNIDGLTSSSKEITFEEFLEVKMIVYEDHIYFDNKIMKGVTVSGVKDGGEIS